MAKLLMRESLAFGIQNVSDCLTKAKLLERNIQRERWER